MMWVFNIQHIHLKKGNNCCPFFMPVIAIDYTIHIWLETIPKAIFLIRNEG
jgi:hypothetical protein